MPTLAIRRLLGGLLARYHVWNGRRAYRAGRLQAAGRHLDQALANGHCSFSAYLLMGKVSYRSRDMQRAMDCFRRAKRTDPTRYALEGFPSGFIESLGRHPTGRAHRKYRIVIEPTRSEDASARKGREQRPLQDALNSRRVRGEGAEQADDEAALQSENSLGDFQSRDEQEQARSRPMLRPGEWADIDWDVEARKLFGD